MHRAHESPHCCAPAPPPPPRHPRRRLRPPPCGQAPPARRGRLSYMKPSWALPRACFDQLGALAGRLPGGWQPGARRAADGRATHPQLRLLPRGPDVGARGEAHGAAPEAGDVVAGRLHGEEGVLLARRGRQQPRAMPRRGHGAAPAHVCRSRRTRRRRTCRRRPAPGWTRLGARWLRVCCRSDLRGQNRSELWKMIAQLKTQSVRG